MKHRNSIISIGVAVLLLGTTLALATNPDFHMRRVLDEETVKEVQEILDEQSSNTSPVYDGLTTPLDAQATVEATYSFDSDIKAAFSDADSDPLSATSVVCGTNCTSVSLNDDVISFTSPAEGTAAFTITVTDGTDNVDGSIPVDVAAAPLTEPEKIAKLLASDGAADDEFGQAVALDGDTAIVGARNDDNSAPQGNDSGSAYVFVRDGNGTWTEQAHLKASDGAPSDWFGQAVALDGDVALIGASDDDDNGSGSGSAYVFTRSGTTWTEQAKLTASDASTSDWFGVSVSLDGDTVLIGSYLDDNANGTDAGSAYVFTGSGANWTQQQKLTASDGAANDSFGHSVSLDGDTVLIGAFYDDDGGESSGSAYVFTRSGSTWTQQQKLTASDAALGDWFGYMVSLDGDTALIGSCYEDNEKGVDAGSAYVFTRSGSTWSQQQKLIASDGAAADGFGASVSIGNNNTALIGACNDDDDGENSGSAYTFTRSGSTWTQQDKLTAGTDGEAGDLFGISVSLDGDMSLIGAFYDDVERGSAYIFQIP